MTHHLAALRIGLALATLGVASTAAAQTLDLPTCFIENRGQWAAETRFAARTAALAVSIQERGFCVLLHGDDGTPESRTEYDRVLAEGR